jgi:hypothetical protein
LNGFVTILLYCEHCIRDEKFEERREKETKEKRKTKDSEKRDHVMRDKLTVK